MKSQRSKQEKIDTIEKLGALIAESLEDLRSDINVRFDQSDDRITALSDRVAAVEGKIAGLYRRIDAELDSRKQHAVRLSRIEKRLGLPARA